MSENKYLEKIAITWAEAGNIALHHAAITAGIHVGQNAITHGTIKHLPTYRKAFQDYFHAGLQGAGYPGKANAPVRRSAFTSEHEFAPLEMGREAQHLSGSAVDTAYTKPRGSLAHKAIGFANPELQMLLEEAHHAGHQARQKLLEKGTGISQEILDGPADIYKHMGRKSAAIYARALRGDFTHLYDLSEKSPEAKRLIHEHLLDIEKKTTHPLTHILTSRRVASDMEAAYKQNPMTGNLFSSLADKPRDMRVYRDNPTSRSKSMYLGAAGMGALDPLAGTLNASKLVLSDKQLLAKSPALNNLSTKINEKFVVEPLVQNTNKGFINATRTTPLVRNANKFLVNNPLGHMEDAGNSLGYAAGKHTRGIRKALSVGEDVQ